jgi:hypothetical protein
VVGTRCDLGGQPVGFGLREGDRGRIRTCPMSQTRKRQFRFLLAVWIHCPASVALWFISQPTDGGKQRLPRHTAGALEVVHLIGAMGSGSQFLNCDNSKREVASFLPSILGIAKLLLLTLR